MRYRIVATDGMENKNMRTMSQKYIVQQPTINQFIKRRSSINVLTG
jgi:hypothetical protein